MQLRSPALGGISKNPGLGFLESEHPNLRLQSGRSLSQEVLVAVADRNEVKAIKAFRSSYPEATLREARDAYAELITQVPHNGG